MVVKTLVGAATPSREPLPVVMIVDSALAHRDKWAAACKEIGVRHHFVGLMVAPRRIAEGFPIVGIILDHDTEQVLSMPPEREDFITDLQKKHYKGPLVGANLLAGCQSEALLEQLAKKLDIPLLIDNGADKLLDYAGMLSWCLNH